MFDTHLSRRRFIAAGSGIAIGTTGLYTVATRDAKAQADVTLGELDVDDREFSPADSALFTPWLLLSGTWSYRTQATPAKWQAFCLIGDGEGNANPVAVDSDETTATEANGTYALRAAVTAADGWTPKDFAVPDGQDAISQTIPIEIAFVVRDGDNGMLVQARVSDTAVVTVTPGGAMARVGGTGTFVAQDDQDDPTPTPPGGG